MSNERRRGRHRSNEYWCKREAQRATQGNIASEGDREEWYEEETKGKEEKRSKEEGTHKA